MTQLIVKSDVNKYLYALLGRYELVDQWWYSANHAFDGKTPDSVYQTGAEGRQVVYEYVMKYAMDYGGS